MKKIILFSIIILIIILGASFYFLKGRLQTGGYNLPIFAGKYNFDYEDGRSPWTTHIKTDINTTFETALNNNQYLQTLKCAGDSSDVGKNPFGPIKPICLQGNGAKMIVPNLGNQVSYSIFYSPTKGGLFEQEHMANGAPFQFFDNKARYGTKYFVIPFNGYEVPTYYPIESKNYLSVWRQVFQRFNGISDDYFNKHIFVIGTSADKFNIDGKEEKRFSVTYYYSVDWAHIKLTDNFTYNLEGVGDGITLEELQRDVNAAPYQTKYQRILNFNKLKPISSIAKKEQIKNAVKNTSSLLWFDINKHIVLERDGQMAIRLYGTIDDAANKCLSGTIILENVQVLEVQDSPCRIY